MDLLKTAPLEDLTIRKVIVHLGEVFDVDTEAFTEYKLDIKAVVEDFKKSNSLAELPKTYRFSKSEDDIILRAIEQYKEAYNVTEADLNPTFREDNDGSNRKEHVLWSEVAELLPHRTKQLIWMRAQRLMRKKNGKWTQDQIDEVRKLVDQKMTWSEIGKMLGKHREDCRGVYLRNQGRIVTGKFTPHEDERIYNAVKKVCPFSNDLDIPLDGIQWKEVANEMENERLGSDYLKRWRIIRNRHLEAAKAETGEGRVGLSEIEKRALVENSILEYLAVSGAEDASDVTWTALDRKYDWQLGTANRTWNTMMKGLPIGTSFEQAIELLEERRGAGRPVEASIARKDLTPSQVIEENTPIGIESTRRPAKRTVREVEDEEELEISQSSGRNKLRALRTPTRATPSNGSSAISKTDTPKDIPPAMSLDLATPPSHTPRQRRGAKRTKITDDKNKTEAIHYI